MSMVDIRVHEDLVILQVESCEGLRYVGCNPR
jgi:hypothetical protein